MKRNHRLWIVIGMVVAFALAGAGWKWTVGNGHGLSSQQLAGWSWDGPDSGSADA
jgi:hypothetical protein